MVFEQKMPAEARFVDVTYRGLPVATQARLTETGAETAFVELEAPLPVGTRVALSGALALEVRVTAVTEQEAATKSPPGMQIAWGAAAVAIRPVRAEQPPVAERATTIPAPVPPPPAVIVAAPSVVVSAPTVVVASVPPAAAAEPADAGASGSFPPDETGSGGGEGRRRRRKKTQTGRV